MEEDPGTELKASSFNSLTCRVHLSPSFFCAPMCAIHRMLWCVSESDTSAFHGCNLELDPVRSMGQEPATTSVLENPVTPAISSIVQLCLGR